MTTLAAICRICGNTYDVEIVEPTSTAIIGRFEIVCAFCLKKARSDD